MVLDLGIVTMGMEEDLEVTIFKAALVMEAISQNIGGTDIMLFL